MPRYDYTCPLCGHTQEEFHSICESPGVECSSCSAVMNRCLPSVAFKMGTQRMILKDSDGSLVEEHDENLKRLRERQDQ